MPAGEPSTDSVKPWRPNPRPMYVMGPYGKPIGYQHIFGSLRCRLLALFGGHRTLQHQLALYTAAPHMHRPACLFSLCVYASDSLDSRVDHAKDIEFCCMGYGSWRCYTTFSYMQRSVVHSDDMYCSVLRQQTDSFPVDIVEPGKIQWQRVGKGQWVSIQMRKPSLTPVKRAHPYMDFHYVDFGHTFQHDQPVPGHRRFRKGTKYNLLAHARWHLLKNRLLDACRQRQTSTSSDSSACSFT